MWAKFQLMIKSQFCDQSETRNGSDLYKLRLLQRVVSNALIVVPDQSKAQHPKPPNLWRYHSCKGSWKLPPEYGKPLVHRQHRWWERILSRSTVYWQVMPSYSGKQNTMVFRHYGTFYRKPSNNSSSSKILSIIECSVRIKRQLQSETMWKSPLLVDGAETSHFFGWFEAMGVSWVAKPSRWLQFHRAG